MNYTVGIENCLVQIGIFQTCEYIYVTQNRWRSVVNRKDIYGHYLDLPIEVLDDSVWYYYGIDMSKDSIEFVKNKYRDYSNCEFVNSLVHKTDNQIITHENISAGRNKVSTDGLCSSKSVSLKTLLSNVPYNVKVVVIDVEGSELDILPNYDFSIMPDVFIVECHSVYISNKLIDLFMDNGYSLTRRDITNVHYIKDLLALPNNTLTFIKNRVLSSGSTIIKSIDYVENYINTQ